MRAPPPIDRDERRSRRVPLPKRFEKHVQMDGITTCWHWSGPSNGRGYGVMQIDGKNVYAHRYAFTAFVGAIPPGLEIDHMCRNRYCVNPVHLRAVTHIENLRAIPRELLGRRLSACRKGHEYTAETTLLRLRGHSSRRICRVCKREYERTRHTQRVRA